MEGGSIWKMEEDDGCWKGALGLSSDVCSLYIDVSIWDRELKTRYSMKGLKIL